MDKEFKELQKDYTESNMIPYAYGNKNRFCYDKSKDIASLIHDDISQIRNDEGYAFSILKKIFPREKIVKELLTYELLNYKPKEKVNSLEELIQIAKSALNKFQYRVGGFNIEDSYWISGVHGNHRFKVKENQRILYNSVEKHHDKELIWFLENFVSYIQNFADESKFNVKYTIKNDDRFRLAWIVIYITQHVH